MVWKTSDEPFGSINIEDVFKKDGVSISETDRLKLAKQILLWIGVICIGVFIGFALLPDNKALAAIFELIKIGALPLITLVVSFYFPNKNN